MHRASEPLRNEGEQDQQCANEHFDQAAASHRRQLAGQRSTPIQLIGSLLKLSVCTRPDISQAVGVLARYMATPSMEHWIAAKGVIRYIAGKSKHNICFEKKSSVEGYCDADYASDLPTRRSTTGFVYILGGGAGAAGFSLPWLRPPQKLNTWLQHKL